MAWKEVLPLAVLGTAVLVRLVVAVAVPVAPLLDRDAAVGAGLAGEGGVRVVAELLDRHVRCGRRRRLSGCGGCVGGRFAVGHLSLLFVGAPEKRIHS